MQLWPAIDLRGGKCVRLKQGDYARETVYSDDPAQMAATFVEQGAEYLHLVDLDGAKSGKLENLAAVERILKAVKIPCELGGGVRDEGSIERLLDVGLTRLVIGTKALKEPNWFRHMCQKFPHQLVLGIDARDGRVATEGWLEVSETPAVRLAKQFEDEPVAALVYTDIAKDGMLAGPNLTALAEMQAAVALPLIASGGVTTIEDVRNLTRAGVTGCIIGRALYEGSLTFQDALRASREGQPT